MKKVLKKINGVTTDSKIDIGNCYIFLDPSTARLLTEGVIDIDYFCYVDKTDINDIYVKPFKLLKDDGTRLVNIEGYEPTQLITQDNYADICKAAFIEVMGWTASEVSIENEI